MNFQPQVLRAIYPVIEMELDSTQEWRDLSGDSSDKYDELEEINREKCSKMIQKIESALKLQELIEKEIPTLNHRGHKSVQTFKWSQLFARRLQTLLDDSQDFQGVGKHE